MVPVVAIPVDRLSLNNHSKVDRKAVQALPLPERAASGFSNADGEDLGLTTTMASLKRVWEEVLGGTSRPQLSIGARTYLALDEAIANAFSYASLKDIHSWLTHCCYCTSFI